ncbi:MAG TPA: aromatic-ring-hydroxylating dioxygenase subunit beta [Phenylobacterium sp.]|uniref:aromatic-ring-hydroxylating dioxygenase subunit beta n=1 Tax=Phenylobacterium sp. TaxID=1871053 RepID=UPI002B45C943|nr:aromatic-ring-hydroxylating dioxygenase subunit beta [Phenylobacterium sp.]HKR90147.1 aromatic-ring-hydroxylating dioxygenase subunit beta [Phenylobacterium sp.]
MADTIVRDQPMTEADAFLIASKFLAHEARLLDERRFDQWYELLDDELLYEVPIRLAMTKFEDETRGAGHIISDTKRRIKVRIDRLNCGDCWSESPPSRTVRIVGSVLASLTDDPRIIEVDSALMLYRQRSNNEPGDLIPVRRYDLLRVAKAEVKLLKRRALLADTMLRTPNLGVFL